MSGRAGFPYAARATASAVPAVAFVVPANARSGRIFSLSRVERSVHAVLVHRKEAHPQELRQAAERAGRAFPAGDPARVVHAVPAGRCARQQRKTEGLQAAFSSIFPISSHNGMARLEFVSFNLGEPAFDVKECQQRGLTFASPLRAKVRLVIMDREATKPTVKEVKEQEVYMGEIPLMTTTGSFVINGTERVIVSPAAPLAGRVLRARPRQDALSGKLLFSARVIPYRGSWLDFEFDPKDILYFRVDRRRKMPATILLKAIGLTPSRSWRTSSSSTPSSWLPRAAFMELVPERLRGEIARFDIADKAGKVVVAKDKRINAKHIRDMEAAGMKRIAVPEDYLLGRVLAHNVVDPETGEIVANANDELTEDTLKKLRARQRAGDPHDLHQRPRPGSVHLEHAAHRRDRRPAGGPHRDLPDDAARRAADRGRGRDAVPSPVLRRRDLRPVAGRPHEGQPRFGRPEITGPMTLTNEDIIDTMKILVELRNGRGEIDDIDHLGNRRVRCVGELAENQFRAGLVRVERAVKERLGQAETENLMPHDLINSKPISASIREFFGSSQLSQFMDQTNPLSEITHKRRVSALGPGGLTRERAGFEVRDVHPTHYGRVLPDRDAGRPEHRPDQLDGAVRAPERVRLPRDAVPQGREGPRHDRDLLPVGDRGRQVRDRAGQRPARQDRQVHRRAGELPRERRVRADVARARPVHGRRAVADRVGGRLADPVPRARRRQPRADGLEHAAPGRALPASGEARSSAPASSAPWRSTRARPCRRCAAAWSTTSTPTASWCASTTTRTSRAKSASTSTT